MLSLCAFLVFAIHLGSGCGSALRRGPQVRESSWDNLEPDDVTRVSDYYGDSDEGHYRKYLDFGINSPKSKLILTNSIVVEVLVIVDKQLGDILGPRYQDIVDYVTIYFYDISLRYKTLRSVNVLFRVSDVIVIRDVKDQGFIEEARVFTTFANYYILVDTFNTWLYQSRNRYAKFDVAMLLTSVRDSGIVRGIANGISGACRINVTEGTHLAGVVVNDNGSWDSVIVAAHEIAHALGAEHDNHEIYKGKCNNSTNIMQAHPENQLRWFFSTCTDESISAYAKSKMGACLRRIDERSPRIVDFSRLKAPSMTDQCKRRLFNIAAFAHERNTGDCDRLKCVIPWRSGSNINMDLESALDNTPCIGGGRCFRGKCRKLGVSVVNVANRQCLTTKNKFTENSTLIFTAYKKNQGTPLDRFLLTSYGFGWMLSTPYQSPGGELNNDTCISLNQLSKDSEVFTIACDTTNPNQGWDLILLGSEEYLIRHRKTQRCLKRTGGNVKAFENCNAKQASMKWKLMK